MKFKRNSYYVFSFAKWKRLSFGISLCTYKYRWLVHSLDGYVFKGNDIRISPYKNNFEAEKNIDLNIIECTEISKNQYIKRIGSQKQ